MNPAEWLRRTAALKPDTPALFHGEDLVADYSEFARRAASIAAALRARGIVKGDRVAILMKNCTDYLEALYGTWWSGAVAVPINAKLHGKEAAWIIEDAGAQLVFASDDTACDLVQQQTKCTKEVILAGSPAFVALRDGPVMPQPASIDRDDVIWLFYTSGTTGRPKGVMITAQNITSMVLGYHDGVGTHDDGDATLYAAPMSHGAGIYNFMFVMGASRHVCPKSGGFDAAEIFNLAARVGPVSMFAAPTMVRRMIDYARQSSETGDGLETIIYAGGPMYFADIVEAVDLLGPRFAQIYGQGECPMAITTLPKEFVSDRNHPRWRERLTSVGYQQSVSRVRVVDPDGNDVVGNDIGEIVVSGTAVMKGYWQNPEATRNAIRNGWLWTGDMGALDQDGFLTLHDRSKDLIISGGSNIYPREVEEILLTDPNVAEASVVGKPHDEWGEVVVACIVPTTGQRLDPAVLNNLCVANIARFKRPKHYIELTALPKNNYGKIVKSELREAIKLLDFDEENTC
ncbi:class I adenylate-forming enzyme family protein [Pseudopelagicola sp. nBUS_20]|uniref:class I adenylate-forming enzyme family protein n=1 Tax=Pseudopelagicola sp. nBUS_20 TaxID=3395317 RepID=UPI003EBAE991